MGNVFFFGWEIKWMVFLQSLQSDALTSIAKMITMLGEESFLIFILGLFYWCIDKKLGHRVSLILTGAMLSSTLIKCLALRRRPYMDNHEIKCIRAAHPKEDLFSPKVQGYSMPSLHASMSVSVYGSLAKALKKPVGIVFGILLPFCIGLSRIYLGVHYPTDVMLGWLVGCVAIFLLDTLNTHWGYKKSYILVLLMGAPGFFISNDVEFFSAWGVTLGLLLGFIYEEKYVDFAPARKWLSFIIRPVGGLVLFAVVSAILKIPGSYISNEKLSLYYRMFRYAMSAFVIIGLYPHLFEKVTHE